MSISCSALTCINGQDAFWLAFLIAFFFGKYKFNHLRYKIYRLTHVIKGLTLLMFKYKSSNTDNPLSYKDIVFGHSSSDQSTKSSEIIMYYAFGKD
jgi:hypothetical protein